MLAKLLRRPVSIEDLNERPRWRIEFLKPPSFARIDPDSRASSPSKHFRKRGIYGWYADPHGRKILEQAGLDISNPHGLVYLGKTSTRTFRHRLSEHIRPNSDLSQRLTCVLTPNPTEIGASAFMRDHLTVRMSPMQSWFSSASKEREWIRSEETRLIKAARPCLNLKGLEGTRNYKHVVQMCKRRNVTPEDPEESTAEPQPWSLRSLVERGLDSVRRLVSKMHTVGPRGPARAEATNGGGASEGNRNKVQDTARPRELTELGRFRRDFWAHVAKRHPDEAPPGWAHSNVYHLVEIADRRVSQYVARHGVGVFFPRHRRESAWARAAAVRASVKWLREETADEEIPDNGWSFLKLDSSDPLNWDRMADWLHDRRLLYERALRETADTRSRKHR